MENVELLAELVELLEFLLVKALEIGHGIRDSILIIL